MRRGQMLWAGGRTPRITLWGCWDRNVLNPFPSQVLGPWASLIVSLPVPPADLYCTLEVDSFGYFVSKAKTRVFRDTTEPKWDEVSGRAWCPCRGPLSLSPTMPNPLLVLVSCWLGMIGPAPALYPCALHPCSFGF